MGRASCLVPLLILTVSYSDAHGAAESPWGIPLKPDPPFTVDAFLRTAAASSVGARIRTMKSTFSMTAVSRPLATMHLNLCRTEKPTPKSASGKGGPQPS